MRLFTVSQTQLALNSVLISVITASLIISYNKYEDLQSLPIVHYRNGACEKVDNFKNGDAYNCNDVDVVLRNYRKSGL